MDFCLSLPPADLSPLEDPMPDSKMTAAQRIAALEETVDKLDKLVRLFAPRLFRFPIDRELEENEAVHEELKNWLRR